MLASPARTTAASPTGRSTPSSLLWVHATLIDTSMTLYDRYVSELTSRERLRYYEEMKTLGEAYSIPRSSMPADYVAFRRYWAAMLAEGLRVTDTTRDVAEVVLHPDLPAIARPASELLRLVTVGTLPAQLRASSAMDWGQAASALLAGSQAAIRRLSRSCPRCLHRFPGARRGLVRGRLERHSRQPSSVSWPLAVRRRRGIPAASVSAASISARIAFSEREATIGSLSPST